MGRRMMTLLSSLTISPSPLTLKLARSMAPSRGTGPPSPVGGDLGLDQRERVHLGGAIGVRSPIICLTFGTRGEDEPALFRMSGKPAIGLRYPLPLGRSLECIRSRPGQDLSPSDSRSHPLRLDGQCPTRALEEAD